MFSFLKKSDRSTQDAESLYEITIKSFKRSFDILLKSTAVSDLRSSKSVVLLAHKATFSELLLAAIYSKHDYVSKIGDIANKKYAEFMDENKDIYFNPAFGFQESYFILSQSMDKIREPVAMCVMEFIHGDPQKGMAILVDNIITLYFDGKEPEGLDREVGPTIDSFMKMSSAINDLRGRLQ